MPPKKKAYSTDWQSRRATKSAIERFEEDFGKSMGIPLNTKRRGRVGAISTGSLAVDYATGIGGIPEGRITEMWGPEHAGKTSTAILNCAQAQKKHPDKMVGWVDMEQTFDEDWAEHLGLDLSRLWRPPIKTAEDAADATKKFVESGLCAEVVLDSIGGMISKKEFEKEADEDTVAMVAKIVTRMVKQVSSIAAFNNTAMLVVNQVRANIGNYGAATQASGGWALRHITTLRLNVKRGGSEPKTIQVEGKPEPVGHEVSIRVEKNKMFAYGKTGTFWLFNRPTAKYGPIGVDPVPEALTFGKRFGIVEVQGGGYLVLPDGERIKGADKAEAYLREKPVLVSEIRERVLATLADEIVEETDGAEEDDPMGIGEMV